MYMLLYLSGLITITLGVGGAALSLLENISTAPSVEIESGMDDAHIDALEPGAFMPAAPPSAAPTLAAPPLAVPPHTESPQHDSAPALPVHACAGAPEVAANPATFAEILKQYRGGEVIIRLLPGTYDAVNSIDDFRCIEVRCSVPAIIDGTPNEEGCRTAKTTVIEDSDNVIIEGLVIAGDYRSNPDGSADYGFAIHIVGAIRIAHSAFIGATGHDISTKERVGYAEVLNNLFIDCARHCIEVGQNANVASRKSTSGMMLVRGNTFENALNAITQRHNQILIVDGNTFKNIEGHAVQNVPYWDTYDAGYGAGVEHLLISTPLYRTEVTNNAFVGVARMAWEGRGAINDMVVVRGNRGSIPQCGGLPMSEAAADSHADEETTAPPILDPESDIPCENMR